MGIKDSKIALLAQLLLAAGIVWAIALAYLMLLVYSATP